MGYLLETREYALPLRQRALKHLLHAGQFGPVRCCYLYRGTQHRRVNRHIDFRSSPNTRHSEAHAGLQLLTHSGSLSAPNNNHDIALLDDFCCLDHDRRWQGDAERTGGLEVDHELDFRRLLDRQLTRVGALEDSVDIGRQAAV